MKEIRQTAETNHPFVYDENGLCEVRDPRALEMLGAGASRPPAQSAR